MPIIKHQITRDFVILPNALVQNPQLSIKAVGLLALMLSLPDNWQFSIAGLETILPRDGRTAVAAAVAELEAAGYVRREGQSRKSGGKLGGAVWTISDEPIFTVDRKPADGLTVDRFPDDRKTDDRKTDDRKPAAKKENNKKENNKKEPTDKEKRDRGGADAPPARTQFSAPSLEEVAAYCKERGNQVDPQRWLDYYTANGWKVGKNPMKDWRASVRTWERNETVTPSKQAGKEPLTPQTADEQRDDIQWLQAFMAVHGAEFGLEQVK